MRQEEDTQRFEAQVRKHGTTISVISIPPSSSVFLLLLFRFSFYSFVFSFRYSPPRQLTFGVPPLVMSSSQTVIADELLQVLYDARLTKYVQCEYPSF